MSEVSESSSPVSSNGLSSQSQETPCTPNQTPRRHPAVAKLSERLSQSPMLKIPASPIMERLGYGTGVGVYLFNRSPRPGGEVRSPWAIKKSAKVDDKSELYAARLEYEALILKKLKHPNIIGYRAFGNPSPDGTYLAMEKAPKSLSDLIEDRIEEVLIMDDCDSEAPFPARYMEKVALDMAKALVYLHEEIRMVHGDIKSANVLVFGDFETIKMCDFGVSRKLKEDGTVDGHYVGTEIWNAMEVILAKRGEPKKFDITAKADIYPFGLTLHEMITLKPPHLSCVEDSFMSTADDSVNDVSMTSANDSVADVSFDELAFDEALQRYIGTRPLLPDIDFSSSYNTILGVFYCCTDEDPTKRPDAKDIVAALEN